MTDQTKTCLRRYTAQGLLAATAICLGVWGVMLSIETDAQAQSTESSPEAQPEGGLDESTYYAMGRLRNELSLTQADLRALGCNESTATACLETALSWYRANKTALHQARNNVLSAKKELYKAHRSVPQPEVQELDELTQALVDAREALIAVKAQAIAAIEASMNDEQKRCWAAARDNTGLSGPLRYVPELSDEQKARIRSAQNEGQDLRQTVRIGELTYQQQQAAEAVHRAMQAPAAAVQLAESRALPVPEAVRQEREAQLLAEQIN